jgi:hypothetical protein
MVINKPLLTILAEFPKTEHKDLVTSKIIAVSKNIID